METHDVYPSATEPLILLFPKSRKKTTRTFMFACPLCEHEYEAEIFSEIEYRAHRLACLAHYARHLETNERG